MSAQLLSYITECFFLFQFLAYIIYYYILSNLLDWNESSVKVNDKKRSLPNGLKSKQCL